MSHVVIKPYFAYAKTKAQISCAVTSQLIHPLRSFATQIVPLCKFLACFHVCTGQFVSHLVGHPEDRLSRVAAQLF